MLRVMKVSRFWIILILILTVAGCAEKTQAPEPLLPITEEYTFLLYAGGYRKAEWTNKEKEDLLGVLDGLTPTDSPDNIYGTDMVLFAQLDTQEIHVYFRLDNTSVCVFNENTYEEEWFKRSEEDTPILSSLVQFMEKPSPEPLPHLTEIPITEEHELVLYSYMFRHKKTEWTGEERRNLFAVLERLLPTEPPEHTIYGTNLVLIAELGSEEIYISFGLNDTHVALFEENTMLKEGWYSCSKEDMLILSTLAPKSD